MKTKVTMIETGTCAPGVTFVVVIAYVDIVVVVAASALMVVICCFKN